MEKETIKKELGLSDDATEFFDYIYKREKKLMGIIGALSWTSLIALSIVIGLLAGLLIQNSL